MLSLLALAASAAASPAHAGAWLPAPGEYYSEMSAGRYSARTSYDGAGERLFFPQGGRLESRSLSLYNEIGWKKRLSLVVSAPMLSVTRRTENSAFQQTSTGLGDVDLGARLRLREGATAVALQLDLLAPLGYENQSDSLVGVAGTRDSVIETKPLPPTQFRYLTHPLGIGSQSVSGRLLVGKALKSLDAYVDLSGGIRFWPNDFASQVTGSAQAGKWFGTSLLLSGHYQGGIAVSRDFMRRVVGALYFKSRPIVSNPGFDVHVIGPELRYRVDDRLDLFAGSNHTMAGKNWIHVDEYYVGMAFRQTKLNRLQGLLGSKTRP